MIKFGNNDTKLYLGANEVTSIYLGSTQVYSGDTPTPPTPTPYDEQYLTIESTSDNNTIYWRSNVSNQGKTISASTDNGSTWTEYTSASGNGTTIATLNSGDTIIFKGENAQYNGQGIFKSTSSFIVYGNVMSLVSGDNFLYQDTLTSASTFSSLFGGCSGLTSAENLIMPATTLAQNCYQQMFGGCSNLTVAPELPATTLANVCYDGMFKDCTSLTVAPELPATTLANFCYRGMFYQCTSLNYIKCLATEISARNCTTNWVSNVAASGTFVKAASMNDWTTGASGIPEDWIVEDEYDWGDQD